MTKLHIFAGHADSERILEPRSANPSLLLDGPLVRKKGIADPATAEMVHDFRNILGTIYGLADLAFLELLDNTGATLRIEEIRAACRDGGELCRQLLNQSRNERAHLDRFDLADVVQRMESQLRVCVPEKFALELDLDPAPLLAVSREQLRRIVLNLVKNAAESLAGRPGVVRIRTGTSNALSGDEPGFRVPLVGIHPPTSLLIVTDTGCGMDRVRRAGLLKGSLARSGGHGLGFTSVRRMVANCGGSLRVSSEPGHGTTVVLAFPCVDDAPDDIVIDPRLNMRPVRKG